MIVDTLWATCSYCKNTTRHAKNTRAAKCGGVWRGEGGELAQTVEYNGQNDSGGKAMKRTTPKQKRTTPKQKLIARLKAEGIVPSDHEVIIEVPRWSTERREAQWLPRCVILHRGSDERLYKQIHAFQTVTEMSSARSLVFQSGEDWPSLFVN